MSATAPDPTAIAWDDLTASALLGTERRPLEDAEGRDAEDALLDALAALSAYRRAGWPLEVDERTLPPATPPETLPRCRPGTAQYLWMLLEKATAPNDALLLAALFALAAKGKRVPHAMASFILDRFLARMTGDPALVAVLRAALGERGRWLADTFPRWNRLYTAEAQPPLSITWDEITAPLKKGDESLFKELMLE